MQTNNSEITLQNGHFNMVRKEKKKKSAKKYCKEKTK